MGPDGNLVEAESIVSYVLLQFCQLKYIFFAGLIIKSSLSVLARLHESINVGIWRLDSRDNCPVCSAHLVQSIYNR